jgi:hypothetical protein
MKLSNVAVTVLASMAMVPCAFAFPTMGKMKMDEIESLARQFTETNKRQVQIPTVGRKAIPDAAHPFQAPSATAQRGPCPGLNIMANYGYINREGITSFSELLYAQQEFMGWAVDLATFLAALSIAVDGNPVNQKVSIGGPDDRVGTIPIVGGTQIPGGESCTVHRR